MKYLYLNHAIYYTEVVGVIGVREVIASLVHSDRS